ncbi:hypothetical protein LOCC1_G008683, partial [Lachnellula occidentalis]
MKKKRMLLLKLCSLKFKTYSFLNLDPIFSHAISLSYSIINNSNKAIYLALILDPRIKKAGLEGIRFTSRISSDIKTLLKADYTKRVDDNDDDLDIYLDLVEDFDIDEITFYFKERRARKE